MKKLSIFILAIGSLNAMEQAVANRMLHISPCSTNPMETSIAVNVEIDLSNKGLKDLACLNAIDNKDAVVAINLNGNALIDLPANAFIQFPHLEFLYLNNNQIAKVDPKAFKGLLYLREVVIIANPIQGLSDDLFECFDLPTIITKTDEIDD